MTPEQIILAQAKLAADLYTQLQDQVAEIDALHKKNAELHEAISSRDNALSAKDAMLSELHADLTRLERDAALHGITGQ